MHRLNEAQQRNGSAPLTRPTSALGTRLLDASSIAACLHPPSLLQQRGCLCRCSRRRDRFSHRSRPEHDTHSCGRCTAHDKFGLTLLIRISPDPRQALTDQQLIERLRCRCRHAALPLQRRTAQSRHAASRCTALGIVADAESIDQHSTVGSSAANGLAPRSRSPVLRRPLDGRLEQLFRSCAVW